MDIHPEDYPEAQNIPLGTSRKIPHLGCSESKAMKVWSEVEGLKFHCFKCGSYHFESSFNSPRERLRRQEVYEAAMRVKADVSFDLPADLSHTLPQRGLAWVGAGGWTLEMMQRYNIGWSQELNRVILPVYPIGYTARAVEGWQKPKYLEKVPVGSMWVSSDIPNDSINGINRFVSREVAPCKSCVLCEDILSAGRCGNYIKAYALLGTSLDTSFLNTLVKYDSVLIWLDPDRGGIQGVKHMIKRIQLVSNVRVIHSGVDPKNCTDGEIQRRLYA